MNILGIETSCDETALCIIETDQAENIRVRANQLYSQASLHAQYGGVYPNMAKREHAKNLTPLLEACFAEATCIEKKPQTIAPEKIDKIRALLDREEGLAEAFLAYARTVTKPDIDLIAVTYGPGLEPALWVGVTFAQALAALWNIPLVPINHMEGHIVVAALEALGATTFKIQPIAYPTIALLISGGHTQLVLMEKALQYRIIGTTKDDAVGEAFDKVARILGLRYPGGPEISRLAEKERSEHQSAAPDYPLPRPMLRSGTLDFSFSGIKTAALYTVKKIPTMTDAIRQKIAREFEDAVAEVIVAKTKAAIETYDARTLIVGGGVSANVKIRADVRTLCDELGVTLMVPEISASTDNAFMIAIAGYLNVRAGRKPRSEFSAQGNLSLE